jgi:hypothetical protein
MEAKEDLIGVPGPLIQIVHAQALVPLKIFHIMGQEGKTGKVGKAFFWRSKRVNHRHLPQIKTMEQPCSWIPVYHLVFKVYMIFKAL